MRIAYFDCFCGAAGDMIVGALIHSGADPDALRERLSLLKIAGYALTIEPTSKQGFSATQFRVELDRSVSQPHRHLHQITDIISGSSLADSVKDRSIGIFTRLAEAEAEVHGTTIEEVHFHEVGAVDALVDIVGAVIALDLLDVQNVICSPLPPGSGTVTCDHGTMPVPAPATAELLTGIPLADCDEPGELVTPTGAAILTTLACGFGPVPPMTIDAIGYGAGTREGKTRPNLLRVLIGEASTVGDSQGGDQDEPVTVLETNLDDASPEIVAHCMERLLSEGALDVYTVPIHMKKSRSGVVLTVLCKDWQSAAMQRVLFAETTTFGVRQHRVTRTTLRRRLEAVSTPFGEIRMKIGERDGTTTASPEYEDCNAAAKRHGVALRDVMAAANTAWAKRAE